MRIGIMLRAYDRPGGIGIYCRNIVDHLLQLDSQNDYVLFYNNQAHVGKYANNENATEIFLPPGNQLVWDQWKVGRALGRYGVDLVFNTKFSVPLFRKVKRIMVLHGASWFVHPELYTKMDILYVRKSMPVYCRAADFLISNSELTTRDFIRILDVPDSKIETVLLAAGDNFVRIQDSTELERVREKYSLPENFLLTVTSYDPRKNFETTVKALRLCLEETDTHLVVVGKDCDRYGRDHDLPTRDGTSRVCFPGWIEQDDLPAIYNLARAFVFPSVYEEFGIPVVEAMACGCPIASSKTGAIPGLTAGSALLSDPFDAKALGQNLITLLTSEEAAENCRKAGLERAKDFSWEKNAKRTLEIFHQVAETT